MAALSCWVVCRAMGYVLHAPTPPTPPREAGKPMGMLDAQTLKVPSSKCHHQHSKTL